MSTDVLNPVDIEQQIQDCKTAIHRGVEIFTQRYDDFLKAKTTYDEAYAHAYLEHDGPQAEKKYAAEVATIALRRKRDTADVAFKHVDKKLGAFEKELSALQSIGRSVGRMYSAERGFGE